MQPASESLGPQIAILTIYFTARKLHEITNKITYTVMINTPPKDSFKRHYCDIIIQLYHLSSVISFEMQLVGSPIDV